jgi:hypothetical protein
VKTEYSPVLETKKKRSYSRREALQFKADDEIIEEYPTVWMPRAVKEQLDAYINECSQEISGLGIVERLEDGDLHIKEVHLLNQEVTGGTTDLDEEAVFEFLGAAEKPEEIKLWWHSHVNMGVFWSGTDDATIQRFGGSGWFLSIVGNKKGEYLCRLDVHDPLRIALDNIQVMIYDRPGPDIQDQIRDEIKQRVRMKSYAPPRTNYQQTQHQGGVTHQPASTGARPANPTNPTPARPTTELVVVERGQVRPASEAGKSDASPNFFDRNWQGSPTGLNSTAPLAPAGTGSSGASGPSSGINRPNGEAWATRQSEALSQHGILLEVEVEPEDAESSASPDEAPNPQGEFDVQTQLYQQMLADNNCTPDEATALTAALHAEARLQEDITQLFQDITAAKGLHQPAPGNPEALFPLATGEPVRH